jgi:queuosine precursor transporter
MTFPRGVIIGALAMAVIVAASNYLVQFPVNEWITWGAFTYPIAFLVTDLTNRAFGPARARQVVYAGFLLAVILSMALATPRIALASGTAFLVAQLLDVRIFDRLQRRGGWWTAPLVSSSVGSAVDTLLFFSIAFAGTAVPWVTLGLGDYAVKLVLALSMLIPFRVMMQFMRPQRV